MKELLVAVLILTAAGLTDAQTTNFFELVKTGTPQQIQAAINQSAYAACFESAIRVVARMQKKPLTEASVTGHSTSTSPVELHGTVKGLSHEEVEALMRAAHEVCPYSNATRGNIEVKLIAE